VFEVDLGDGKRAVNIWGDNIIFMGSERTKVKFKEKFNFELYWEKMVVVIDWPINCN